MSGELVSLNRDGQRETAVRVGRNSAWLLFGEVLGRTLGAIWQVLLARYLGVQLFGEFSLALTLAAVLGVLADMGLCTLVTREVSRHHDHPFRILRGALIARGVLAVVLGIIAVVAVSVAGRPSRLVFVLAILAAGQLVQGQGELLAAAHRGRERMRLPVLVGLFCRLGLVSSGIVAMALGAPVQVLAGLVAFWASPLLLLAPALRDSRESGEAGTTAPGMLRRAAPIGAGIVLWTIYFRADLLIVSFLHGDAEAGIFAAPFRLAEAALLLAGPVIGAAFPVLSSRSPDDAVFREVFRGILRTLIFLATPIAVLFMFDGRALLGLVLGAEYLPGSRSLVFLAGTIPISFVAGPFLASLLARNREAVYLRIMGIGVLVNFAIAFALIPGLGATGAALAMLLTEAVILTLALFLADLSAEVRRVLILLSRALPAALSVVGLLMWLTALGISFPIRAPLVLIIAYPLLAWAFGLISPARILLFLQALSGRE